MRQYRIRLRIDRRGLAILLYLWATLALLGLLLLFASTRPAFAQHITFSLQSHGETCDQIGAACDRLSLWTATIRNTSNQSRTVTKAALLERLVGIGVAGRDDPSAARVILHRANRGGWKVFGGTLQELLFGCAQASLPKNAYLSAGCGVTALFGPRLIERAAGLEPKAADALAAILSTQHLELSPGTSGLMVLFSTRYSGQATYELAMSGGGQIGRDSEREVGNLPGRIHRVASVAAPARLQTLEFITAYPPTDEVTDGSSWLAVPQGGISQAEPAKGVEVPTVAGAAAERSSPPLYAWEIPAGTWLPVGNYWGPCAEVGR